MHSIWPRGGDAGGTKAKATLAVLGQGYEIKKSFFTRPNPAPPHF
jgi:hypothetical protein